MLIAASDTITINGSLHANGGAGENYDGWGAYNGSGGAIRLVADQILGSGSVYAYSGGYPGRIRLEANTTSSTLNLDPTTVPVSPLPLTIWPPANAPTVRVISVAGQTAPSDPHASLNSGGADLTLAKTNAVAILLQTSNFPTNGTVNVHITLLHSSPAILQADLVSGDSAQATWQVTTKLPVNEHTVIQARAVSN